MAGPAPYQVGWGCSVTESSFANFPHPWTISSLRSLRSFAAIPLSPPPCHAVDLRRRRMCSRCALWLISRIWILDTWYLFLRSSVKSAVPPSLLLFAFLDALGERQILSRPSMFHFSITIKITIMITISGCAGSRYFASFVPFAAIPLSPPPCHAVDLRRRRMCSLGPLWLTSPRPPYLDEERGSRTPRSQR